LIRVRTSLVSEFQILARSEWDVVGKVGRQLHANEGLNGDGRFAKQKAEYV
jgi:hypothetical protein